MAPFLRDEAETKKRKPRTKENTKARETFGKIEGIGDVLSDGPRKFLGSQLIKRRESRPSLLGHDRAEDLSDTLSIAIYEKQDRLFRKSMKSLILAQNERWWRVLYMQVERGSNAERRTGE